MKIRRVLVMAAMGLLVLFGTRAHAWVSAVSAGSAGASTTITLTGNIQSFITVALKGSVNQRLSSVTTVSSAGPVSSVDFGGISIAGAATNGERHEVAGPDGSFIGYYLVATLSVETRFAGVAGASARLDIQRANQCGAWPDVPCGEPGSLFFARTNPPALGPLTWPAWSGYPDVRYGQAVFPVPNASYVPGPGNLGQGIKNGQAIEHQLSVWVDADAPPGLFRTEIKYTVTLS
jgi:hypothetical protein